MILAETYTELMTDRAHLLFEITLTVIQDVGIGLIAWPLIKRTVRKHDAKKHAHEHCEDVHQGELFDKSKTDKPKYVGETRSFRQRLMDRHGEDYSSEL